VLFKCCFYPFHYFIWKIWNNKFVNKKCVAYPQEDFLVKKLITCFRVLHAFQYKSLEERLTRTEKWIFSYVYWLSIKKNYGNYDDFLEMLRFYSHSCDLILKTLNALVRYLNHILSVHLTLPVTALRVNKLIQTQKILIGPKLFTVVSWTKIIIIFIILRG
jgi:hypothetical protein